MEASPIVWSVIIPTMNRADSLAVTLRAMAKQSLRPLKYEILVVDNGSTDHTAEVVAQCVNEFPSHTIRYIEASPPGLLTGRHKGALESRGAVLTFVDDDVDVAPNYAESILTAFRDPKVCLVGGPCRPLFETEPPDWLEHYYHHQSGKVMCVDLSLCDLGDSPHTIHPCMVWGLNFSIRRETLWECGGFHPDNIPQSLQMYQGDGETGLSDAIARSGKVAHYVPGAAVTHIVPSSRLTEEYFCKRYFYQGVCSSYTEIRTKRSTQNLSIPVPVRVNPESPEAIHQRIHNAYVDGYIFHQSAVKQSPTLLQWVLRPDYWDYELPKLEDNVVFRREWADSLLSMMEMEGIDTSPVPLCDKTADVNSAFLPLENIDADPRFFYGEIPQADFMSILRQAKALGNVEQAISEWCDETNNSYFRTYALDPRRALGVLLLGDVTQKRLLDYGCGVGSLGVPAALMGANVTFVDSCLPRLRMALLRAQHAGAKDFRGIACKTWHSLPTDCANMDAILINGVMEWIPSTVGASFETVVQTQLDFLSAMRDRLHADGRIFLAIENRFALQYLMGYPEDHTEIPYLSIMDRARANLLHQQKTGKDFTAWTWGLKEYEERLPSAGLCIEQAYALFPDYRFPVRAVSLDDDKGLYEGMQLEAYAQSPERQRTTEYLYHAGLLRHAVYSYALILKRSEA